MKTDPDKAINYLQVYRMEGCKDNTYFRLAVQHLKRHKKPHEDGNPSKANTK